MATRDRRSASVEPLRLRRAAKGLVRRGEAVLVVKERHADGTPFWTLPGGGCHPGESLPVALNREFQEELRCPILVGDRIDDFEYCHRSTPETVSHYTVYAGSVLSSPEPNPDDGILACAWRRPDDFPSATLPEVRDLFG